MKHITNSRAWYILIILIFIYWIGGRLTHENTDFATWIINKKIRYALHFGMLILVMGVGFFGLKSLSLEWPKQLWLFIYSFVLITLLVLGGIDYFFMPFKQLSFRNFITSLHVFFSTPVTYGVLFFLFRFQQKNKH